MLLDCLKKVKDTRGKQAQQYDQASVLFLSVLAVLCGAISYRKIHIFIAQKFLQLKEILGLKWRKPPAYTTIRGIIHGVDEQSLEEQYRLYTQDLISNFGHRTTGKKFAAGDGKALRNSYNHMEDQKAKQVFSIFDTDLDIIFAHEEIDEKTNEIPVFQKLVAELGLKDFIFTLDALHCQKKP
jgi:hypothetical protein